MMAPLRRLLAGSAYRSQAGRSRASHNRVLDVVDAWDKDPTQPISGLARRFGTTTRTIKDRVPTYKVGGRLQLAPPSERHLYRGPQTMLADIDGRPQVVRVIPSTDAQWASIRGHDAAVYAAVAKDDDSRLAKYGRRIVVDAETGIRYRFFVQGDGLRDAADTGGFEMSDLFYSGGRRHDIDALLADLGDEP